MLKSEHFYHLEQETCIMSHRQAPERAAKMRYHGLTPRTWKQRKEVVSKQQCGGRKDDMGTTAH